MIRLKQRKARDPDCISANALMCIVDSLTQHRDLVMGALRILNQHGLLRERDELTYKNFHRLTTSIQMRLLDELETEGVQ